MKIRPLGSKVVLKEIEARETTISGIVIPSTAKEKPDTAEVIEVGPGEVVDGREIKMYVKKGDVVLFSKYGGTEVKLDNENYLIVRQDEILAVLD